MGAFLLAPDHGALDLLHALSWDSLLARLAPAVRPGAKLGDGAEQWATHLTLLALQCMVLLPDAQLPAWLQALSQPLGEHAQLDLPVIMQRWQVLMIHEDAEWDDHRVQSRRAEICVCISTATFRTQAKSLLGLAL